MARKSNKLLYNIFIYITNTARLRPRACLSAAVLPQSSTMLQNHRILSAIDLAGLGEDERDALEELAAAGGHGSLEGLLLAFTESPAMRGERLRTAEDIRRLFLEFMQPLMDSVEDGDDATEEDL